MKTVLILLSSIVLAACTSSGSGSSSVDLPVKLINGEMSKDCTFIGVTNGAVYNAFQYPAENIADARLKAANEAKNLGANSAVITSTDVEDPGHNVTVSMEVYNCSAE